MSNYTDLKRMYSDWIKESQNVISAVAPIEMKDAMDKAITYTVYLAYTPESYERRYNEGGLGDISNMEHDIDIQGSRITVTLRNNAKGSYDDTNSYIGDIVASGDGYTWTNSEIYKSQQERDFYEETANILRQGKIVNSIKKELKKRGIILKN
ncbi:MAG: hypothetical protein RSC24_06640 [Clostridium sp.]